MAGSCLGFLSDWGLGWAWLWTVLGLWNDATMCLNPWVCCAGPGPTVKGLECMVSSWGPEPQNNSYTCMWPKPLGGMELFTDTPGLDSPGNLRLSKNKEWWAQF